MKTKQEILDYLSSKKSYYEVELDDYNHDLHHDYMVYSILIDKVKCKLLVVKDLIDFINDKGVK